MLYWNIMERIQIGEPKKEPWELWEEMGRPVNTPFTHVPGCQRIYPGELRCQCWDRATWASPFPNRATRRNWKARGLVDATR